MGWLQSVLSALDSRQDKQQYLRLFNYLALFIILFEIIANSLIIKFIAYTEIDWIAYMQEVEGVVNGTWDYTQLKGDTGPLVYPGGFVAIYWVLYWITDRGKNIALAQWIFAGLYVLTIFFVLNVYKHSRQLPLWAVVLVCLSRRVHSIFVLRLFNDCFAMLFLFMAMYLFIKDKWTLGCFFYSVGVSVKMNILLFAPGLAILLVKRFGMIGTIPKLLTCAAVQAAVAYPFMMENPYGYIKMSFDLGRKFFFVWSVNWKFLPEEVFLSDWWSQLLLFLTVLFVILFAVFKWTHDDGLKTLAFFSWMRPPIFDRAKGVKISAEHIATVMFMSNFIGVVFSRSLHFQFYVWYWFSLPYLLWTTQLPVVIKLVLLGAIELVWNIFPSNPTTSAVLLGCHLILLFALFFAKMKPAYYFESKPIPNMKSGQAVRTKLE